MHAGNRKCKPLSSIQFCIIALLDASNTLINVLSRERLAKFGIHLKTIKFKGERFISYDGT